MTAGPRDYEVGTERALFRLSSGTCYAPGCEVQIMSLIDGHAVVGVQIAHIRGANPKGARYNPDMTDDEGRRFANLVLLCVGHHNLVDRLEPEKHPSEVLEQWKRDNEPEEGIGILAPRLTEETLVAILEQFAADHHPVRQVEVEVRSGLVTHRDGVASFPLEALGQILDLNPHLAGSRQVVVADVRNTGTLPVTINSIDFLGSLKAEDVDEESEVGLMGRNDFGASNPPLPYRLLDSASVPWFANLSSIQMFDAEPTLTLTKVRAVVQLGSGERIYSPWVEWPDDLRS